MSKSDVAPKMKPGPKPTGKGTQVQVRLHQPLLRHIDDWADENISDEHNRTRPEAVRRMLKKYLQSYGKDFQK